MYTSGNSIPLNFYGFSPCSFDNGNHDLALRMCITQDVRSSKNSKWEVFHNSLCAILWTGNEQAVEEEYRFFFIL